MEYPTPISPILAEFLEFPNLDYDYDITDIDNWLFEQNSGLKLIKKYKIYLTTNSTEDVSTNFVELTNQHIDSTNFVELTHQHGTSSNFVELPQSDGDLTQHQFWGQDHQLWLKTEKFLSLKLI